MAFGVTSTTAMLSSEVIRRNNTKENKSAGPTEASYLVHRALKNVLLPGRWARHDGTLRNSPASTAFSFEGKHTVK